MSFRNRLTTFFILMVLVPILGIGALGFRLIHDTSTGRAGARANGLVTAASSMYSADEAIARADAKAITEQIATLPSAEVHAKLGTAVQDAGLTRVVVVRNGRTIADIGSHTAVAPGTVTATVHGSNTRVTASMVTAAQFAQTTAGPASAIVLTQNGQRLASTISGLPAGSLPGSLTVNGTKYAADTSPGLAGFGTGAVTITALSDFKASSNSTSNSVILEIAFLVGLAILAFLFAMWASRSLNNVIKRFLAAATRLADRDFSAAVPVEGNDEFGQLAEEFNRMSVQLEQYINALGSERERLRDSILRAGQVLESNLDPEELQKLTLSTAIAGIAGGFGRLSVRDGLGEPFIQVQREGSLAGAGPQILAAEEGALSGAPLGEAQSGGVQVLAARLGPYGPSDEPSGLLSVGRRGAPFTQDDRNLLQSLVAQATTALDNAQLHKEIEQKAITDPLTGLANHGEFQNVLAREMEDTRRYQYPVGLILLDIDNFKAFNDSYGHPQGDLVLKHVARVLAESSREGDTPARYGGEEMALILPHTDIEGSHTIAERVRRTIEDLQIPRLDGEGALSVTASVGVSASIGGHKEELVQEADVALYRAKRTGKNRTVQGSSMISPAPEG